MAYVLDTSAIMRLLLDEPGSEAVEHVLGGDEKVVLPFMVIMELHYVLLRRLSPSRVEHLIETLRASPAEVVESDPEWARRAAEVKSRGGLSVADAWIASLALLHGGELVHKDPEFDAVAGLRSLKLA